MAELANCSTCDAVFVKSIRDICQNCFKEEERAFETVYSFLREQKNREATLKVIVEATEVAESLIIKFIKAKRLRTSQFPNLAYPCEKCGDDTISGKLCAKCSKEFLDELQMQDQIDQRTLKNKELEKEANIYYSFEKNKK